MSLLWSLQDHDLIRNNSSNTTIRINSVNVFGDDAYCHLVALMPYSQFRPDRVPLQNGNAQGQAAVLLAAQHLNTGNGSLVKEIEGLHNRCNIKFTAEFFDTELSQVTAVDHVITLVSRQPPQLLPCAFLGAARSAVSIPTSIITGLRNFPQISYKSTSKQLDDTSQHPLFGRLIPSDEGTAVPIILYLRNQLQVKHLAVVHINDAYGNAYALGLQLAAAEYAPDMKVVSVDMPFEATPAIMEKTIRILKETKYRYLFGIIFSTAHYEPFMTEAYRQGIAGTGQHSWFFSDGVSTGRIETSRFPKDSPLHLATRGAFWVGAVGGVVGMKDYDLFLATMNELNNKEDIAYLKSKQPQYPNEPEYEPLPINDDYFEGVEETAAFLYDSTVALGLAACSAAQPDTYFDGKAHFEAFVNTSFNGATGRVELDPETGTRVATSARFTLLNFVQDEIITKDDTVKFAVVETHVYDNGEWVNIRAPIYNDGSTVPHPDLADLTVDMNYIGAGWRAAGFSMAVVILLVATGWALWTRQLRKTRVVRASQPIFLYMICAGCFLMGSSIFPLGIDDEVASTDGCTVACIAFPWIVSCGWVVAFSALFTKTHRINKIIHGADFRRIVVTPRDVMKPMLTLMAVNVFILTLWTALDPPQWERDYRAEDEHGRPTESYGYCSYDDSIGYMIALGVVFVLTLGFACYEAYVARDISTEFAESEYIAKAMGSILVFCFIGVPVLIIADGENPTASFFVMAAIIFVVSVALLLMIFVPKATYKKKRLEVMRPGSLLRNTQNGPIRRPSPSHDSDSGPTTSDDDSAPGVKVFSHRRSSASRMEHECDAPQDTGDSSHELTSSDLSQRRANLNSSDPGTE